MRLAFWARFPQPKGKRYLPGRRNVSSSERAPFGRPLIGGGNGEAFLRRPSLRLPATAKRHLPWCRNVSSSARAPTSGQPNSAECSGSEIVGYGNGTTINRIPLDALQKTRFAVPSREVVEEIDRLVTPLFARIEAAEDESQTLADLRDTLLPKLISGEIRVREAQKLVESAT